VQVPLRPADWDPKLQLLASLMLKAVAVILAGIAVFGFGAGLGASGNYGGWPVQAALGITGAVSGMIAAYAFRLSKQVRPADAEKVRRKDSRAPVLYLRSFPDDLKTGAIGPSSLPMLPQFSVEQEHVEKALRRIGPLIGAAIPERRLQTPGLSTVRLQHEDWEGEISRLMRTAALVVMRIGNTPSLLREFEMALQQVPPERLLLLISGHHEYVSFQNAAAGLFRRNWPEYRSARNRPHSTIAGLIYFRPDGEACFVPLETPRWRSNTVGAALIHAMQPVHRQIGLPWTPAPLSWSKLALAGAGGAVASVATYFVLTSLAATGRDELTQSSCSEATFAKAGGRVELNRGLPEQQMRNCCSAYPWLKYC
jgi:hypothetical protein